MSRKRRQLNRRDFLRACGLNAAGLSLLLGGTAQAQQKERAYGASQRGPADDYDFLFARVKFKSAGQNIVCPWNAYPGGERFLLEEFSSVVRCKVRLEPGVHGYQPQMGNDEQFNGVAEFGDLDQVRKYPFLFMTSEGRYTLKRPQTDNLEQYVNEGGFLLMDDCVLGQGGDLFYQSSLVVLEQAFGRGCVTSVPHDHEIFHNVYDMGSGGMPYVQGQRHGAKGVFVGNRLAVFLSATDLHCAWTDRQGIWFGRTGRECHKKSIEMGVNILMYALSH